MTGHFYHVPTFSILNPGNPAVWDTQFRGGKRVKIKRMRSLQLLVYYIPKYIIPCNQRINLF